MNIGLAYAWYGSSQCQLNQFFISFNWILCFFVSLLSVLPQIQECNPKSGLAQAAMVSIYSTYLVASAISSEPDSSNHCGPSNTGTETSAVALGYAFTFLALAYSTSSAASNSKVLAGEDVPLLSGTDDEEALADDEQDVFSKFSNEIGSTV
jgi:hypothetical protein